MESHQAISNNRLLHFACVLMPRRIKRLVFLASFAAVARKITETDDQTIHLINQVLQLASDDAALKLPILVKSIIWKDFQPIEDDVRHLINHDEDLKHLEGHAEHILSYIPAWFSYGDSKEMVDDILSLFQITPDNFQLARAA